MQEPRRTDEERNLSAVPDDGAGLASGVKSVKLVGGGGGGIMRDAGLLWFVCAFGAILATIGVLSLSHDPAVAMVYGLSSRASVLSQLRVYFELFLIILGTACMFTAITCIRARTQARKIEKDSGGALKSLRAKRLDHVSNDTIFDTMLQYIFTLLGRV